MKSKILCVCILFLLLFSAVLASKVAVPGKRFAQYEIGQSLHSIVSGFRSSVYQKFNAGGSVFKDILKVSLRKDVVFDLFINVEAEKITFFFHKEKLVGVFYRGNDVLIEGVSVATRGLDFFQLTYGVSKGNVIERKNHSLLVYLSYGFAVLDDRNDGFVDGFFLFKPL